MCSVWQWRYCILGLLCVLSVDLQAALPDPTRPQLLIPKKSGLTNASDEAVVTPVVTDKAALPALQLNSVLIRQNLKLAVINQQTLRIGQQIEQFRLTSIQQSSVVLQSTDGRTVRLSLGQGAQTSSREQGR